MWIVTKGEDYDNDEVYSRHRTENAAMDSALAIVNEDWITLNDRAWERDGLYVRVRHIFSKTCVGAFVGDRPEEEIFVSPKKEKRFSTEDCFESLRAQLRLR